MVDPDEVTVGLIEDLSSGSAAPMLDQLAAAIVGGDLPKGNDRKGLRGLTLPQFAALCKAVLSSPLPNAAS